MYGIINKRTLCAHNMIHEVKKGAELIDWLIENGFLRIEYDYRLPFLYFADRKALE